LITLLSLAVEAVVVVKVLAAVEAAVDCVAQ
jgi:hypothetical protein